MTLQDRVRVLPSEIQRRIALMLSMIAPVCGGLYDPSCLRFKRALSKQAFHRAMRVHAGLPTRKTVARNDPTPEWEPVTASSLRLEAGSYGVSKPPVTFVDQEGRKCLAVSGYSGTGGIIGQVVRWLRPYGLVSSCVWYRVPRGHSAVEDVFGPTRDYVIVVRLR